MMRSAHLYALATLLIAGCSTHNVSTDMGEAKELFKQRQAETEKLIADTHDPVSDKPSVEKPKRKLVQFTYGPSSFENLGFVEYLQRSSSDPSYLMTDTILTSSIQLSNADKARISDERRIKRKTMVVREKQKIQAQIASFNGVNINSHLSMAVDLTVRGVGLSKVLSQIHDKTGVNFVLSSQLKEEKIRISGNFQGEVFNILHTLSSQYGVQVRLSVQESEVRLFSGQEKLATSTSGVVWIDPYLNKVDDEYSRRLISHLTSITEALSTGANEEFNARFTALHPTLTTEVATKAYEIVAKGMQTLNSKLERFDRQTNLLLSGVSVQDASNEGEISKEVMNKGIADSNLCAGQEVVTEKLFVYFESPTVVCQFLKGYFTPAQPMLGSFPINGQLQGQVNGSMVNSYNSNINASAAYTANQGVSGMNNFASATNGLGSLGTNSSSAANQTQSSNLSKSSQGTAGQQNQGCTLNIDPDASVSESGVLTIGKNASTKSIGNETDSKNNNSAVETERKVAAEKSTSSKHNSKARDSSQTLEVTQVCEGKKPRFKLATDPTGVIVSGPPGYVDLAVRLARDVDIPTIEVLAEVYLVEVQKNWAQTIETQFARGVLGGYPQSSVGMVSQILNTANLVQGSVTGGYQGTFAANGGDILAFINLLESNSVGRSISSPTLIAKNGQDAVLEKTLTLRKSITNTAAPYSSNGTTIAGAVTTQVESLDVPFKITLTPVINQHNRHVSTSFEYTETVLYPPVTTNPLENSTMLNHVRTVLETAPGEVVVLAGLFKENNNIATTSMPGMSALGVLAPLLGGSNDKTSQSTELLVFIKPTVIEPREVLGRH